MTPFAEREYAYRTNALYTPHYAALLLCLCVYPFMFTLDGMISAEEHDQQKPLHAAAFVLQGFIGGDKETLLLSSIIYVVDCITFSDASVRRSACWHRGAWDL